MPMDYSEWKVVTKKSKHKSKKRNRIHDEAVVRNSQWLMETATSTQSSSQFDPTEWKIKVEAIVNKLRTTPWWLDVLSTLQKLQDSNPINYLRCLGLGSFLASSNARHQLACAILLQRSLPTITCCFISDPAMDANDKQIAEIFNYQVDDNALDNLSNKDGNCTLFFMPHCSRFLYDRVLEENEANQFQGLVLFGNSLSRYVQIRTSRDKPTIIDLIYNSGTLMEAPCLRSQLSTSENAFNDLSITTISVLEEKSKG